MTCPWVCETGRSPVTSPRTPQRSPSPTASGVLSPEPSESSMLSRNMLSPELVVPGTLGVLTVKSCVWCPRNSELRWL